MLSYAAVKLWIQSSRWIFSNVLAKTYENYTSNCNTQNYENIEY